MKFCFAGANLSLFHRVNAEYKKGESFVGTINLLWDFRFVELWVSTKRSPAKAGLFIKLKLYCSEEIPMGKELRETFVC